MAPTKHIERRVLKGMARANDGYLSGVAIEMTPVAGSLSSGLSGVFSREWLVRFLEHRGRRHAHYPPDPEMAEGGRPRRRDRDRRCQGNGVVSPLLANIYLHHVLDLWAARWRRREATGDMIIVRYADDVIIGFEHEDDAQRFLDAMRARFEEFELTLHPDKTRLIEFGRHAAANRKQRGLGKPDSFAFLGFTFICGKSRTGHFMLQRKTRSDRMRAKLKEIKAQMRQRMHWSIPEQGKWLAQIVSGHFEYFAVPTNFRALRAFFYRVTNLWQWTLRRRSQRDGSTWERVAKLAADYLPKPRIHHPWPSTRFAVKHPR